MKKTILFLMLLLSGCVESAESSLLKKISVGDCVDLKQSSSSVYIPGGTVSGPFDRDIDIPSRSTTVGHDSFIINVYKGPNQTCTVEVDKKVVDKKQKITEVGADYIVISGKKIIPIGKINEINLFDWKKFYESEVKEYREEKAMKESEAARKRAYEIASKRIETDENHDVKLRCQAEYKATIKGGELVKEKASDLGKFKDFFIGISPESEFLKRGYKEGCRPHRLGDLIYNSIQFQGEAIEKFFDDSGSTSRRVCMDNLYRGELDETILGLARRIRIKTSSILWLTFKVDPSVTGFHDPSRIGDLPAVCENFGKDLSQSFIFVENNNVDGSPIYVGTCRYFGSSKNYQAHDDKKCRPDVWPYWKS